MTFLVSCAPSTSKVTPSEEGESIEILADTMITVTRVNADSTSFIIMRMNKENAYISMADSIIPSEADSAIALCVEAAFTGELLKDFKSTNIGGDYVIDGVFHKGYKCKANTGFLYADKKIFTISSSDHCEEWIAKAQVNGGSLFQQILIVQNGENTYKGTPIKPTTKNIYRSACILNDGNFAVIQSTKPLTLKDYIEGLIKIGVSTALYLDMGKGWNYGWYRETPEAKPVRLFEYRTPYQTNWLLIKLIKS